MFRAVELMDAGKCNIIISTRKFTPIYLACPFNDLIANRLNLTANYFISLALH